MSTSNSSSAQFPNNGESSTIQMGKELYFPNFTAPAGFGGELKINNGVVVNPCPIYQPHSDYSVPMMPHGADPNAFDREPMYNLIDLNRVKGNDTAYLEVDATYSQPPDSSEEQDVYTTAQMGNMPSLPRDNNMLLVGNNLLRNSIFLG